MANPGNAWHIPDNPEPARDGHMRDYVGPLLAGTAVTIFSGNQFQGTGNPGNQTQDGSALLFRRATDANWKSLPLTFDRQLDNNKYYAATIPASTFSGGDEVQYYLRIAYSDHDPTLVHVAGGASATTLDENEARNSPFTYTVLSSAGQWGPVLTFPSVPIHTHVLPNGHVLMWGRRENPTGDLDTDPSKPFVWDPADPTDASNPANAKTVPTSALPALPTPPPPPGLNGRTTVNLFCSGHAFLPDGRLLVVGGHWLDGDGLDQASLYDWRTNSWTATARMKKGRWYPTATTLPDGGILVLAGSSSKYSPAGDIYHNIHSEVWRDGVWTPVAQFTGENDPETNENESVGILPYFPRTLVASDGRVFMAGPLEQTYLVQTGNNSKWTPVAPRAKRLREYAPAVMYDKDKVVFIGGGNDQDTQEPTADVEIIDLTPPAPQWRLASPMRFRRRQHNAVLLPDGTILVTGGTRGGGGPNRGFNDLTPGQPVHDAELWDPAGGADGPGAWTVLAAEDVDRCYHGTSVLLPDATVLSAGGGEYRPDNVKTNDPKDSHRNGQVFSPPYLFKGPRPTISSAPTSVKYGETFPVGTAQPNDIGKVTWIRLSSVTHSFNQNQRINFLDSTPVAGGLSVTAPASSKLCPPGHYMLFILNKAGVPSKASIIQIQAEPAVPLEADAEAVAPRADAEAAPARETTASVTIPLTAIQVSNRQIKMTKTPEGRHVVAGITGTCPYGLRACWAGAYHALYHLDGVDLVGSDANQEDSTADIFLKDNRLPALSLWDEQFRSIVNGTYVLRGVEITVQGSLAARNDQLFLAGSEERPEILLLPLRAGDMIQLDGASGGPRTPEEKETQAYGELAALSKNLTGSEQVTVTGPLRQGDEGYRLNVRVFTR